MVGHWISRIEGIDENHENWCSTNKNEFTVNMSKLAIIFKLFIMILYNLYSIIDSEGWLRTKLYDKRDDFNFPIVNFPFICSYIPAAPAYGVYTYISQFIRYSRAYRSHYDFLDIVLVITRSPLNQGILVVKLRSSLLKCYGRYHDLFNCYSIFMSQITSNMLCSS